MSLQSACWDDSWKETVYMEWWAVQKSPTRSPRSTLKCSLQNKPLEKAKRRALLPIVSNLAFASDEYIHSDGLIIRNRLIATSARDSVVESKNDTESTVSGGVQCNWHSPDLLSHSSTFRRGWMSRQLSTAAEDWVLASTCNYSRLQCPSISRATIGVTFQMRGQTGGRV